MEFTINIPDIVNTLQIRGFHVKVVHPGWSYHEHYHLSFELLYCWSGKVNEWLDQKQILFKTGDWLLISPGVKHKTLNKSKDSFTYLSFLFDIDDPDFRREIKSFSQTLVTNEEASLTQLPSFLRDLDEQVFHYQLNLSETINFCSPSIIDKLGLQACILNILRNIISILQSHQASPEVDDQIANGYEIDTAFEIERLINNQLTDPDLSVQSIAEKIGMSRTQCTKIFSKIYGVSPRQYITSQRLLRAKDKLIHTNQTISEIAEELGFSSLSHFSRQFKKIIGISPNHYRPRHYIHH